MRFKNWLVFIIITLFLTACSNNSSDDSASMDYDSDGAGEMMEMTTEAWDGEAEEMDTPVSDSEIVPVYDQLPDNQMVVSTAFLELEVKDMPTIQDEIRDEVMRSNGYVVLSEVSNREFDETSFARYEVRIPQESFNTFIETIEGHASEVLERVTQGEDVSHEYVDLQARLSSKEIVEERLLNFLDEAESTEDLLKISDDLMAVQEEIERLKGQIEYLENRVAYATVHLTIYEEAINVPKIKGEDDLNTVERMQQLFMGTINFLISIGAGLVVFFVGLSPILIPVAIIAVFVWLRVRKLKQEKDENQDVEVEKEE